MQSFIKRRIWILSIILCISLLFSTKNSFAALPKIGEQAPNFSLPDQHGKIHTLSQYRGKIVILAFYPADFTVGCTMEAHVNTEYYKKYVKNGITLLGISVQTPQSHKAFCETYGIPYTLLADTTGKVAREYGVLGKPFPGKFPKQAWYKDPKRSAKLYYKLNPKTPPGLAKRVTFIIGKHGKIAYIDTQVNKHILTCAPRWIYWVQTHRKLLSTKY